MPIVDSISIHFKGDSSVGISGGWYAVDLFCAEIDEDCREDIRKAAQELGFALSGEKCYAVFSDECPDCGRVGFHSKQGPKTFNPKMGDWYNPVVWVCVNPNCITNIREE